MVMVSDFVRILGFEGRDAKDEFGVVFFQGKNVNEDQEKIKHNKQLPYSGI